MSHKIGFWQAFGDEAPNKEDIAEFGSASKARAAMETAKVKFAMITGILTFLLGLLALATSPWMHVFGYVSSFFFLRFAGDTFFTWIDYDPEVYAKKRNAMGITLILGAVYFLYSLMMTVSMLRATF